MPCGSSNYSGLLSGDLAKIDTATKRDQYEEGIDHSPTSQRKRQVKQKNPAENTKLENFGIQVRID